MKEQKPMSTFVKESKVQNITQYQDCANCGACYSICPTDAISVQDGVFYSVIVDNNKCIHCSKCISVCPVNSFVATQNITAGYAAIHKKNEIVMTSSSGGVYAALAEHILEQGGIVWGADYSEGFDKVLFHSTRTVPLENLKRSKYVESLVGDSFREIRDILANGTLVLFCGTPCQVAGLKRFVGEQDNLYTVDFSCGGLPSHYLYQNWLETLEKKHRSKITGVNFRSKHYGWGIHCVEAFFDNGKKYTKVAMHDPFFATFLTGRLSVRPYCYKCQFADNHYSDIVLADYWKYKETFSKRNDSGISLVLINSDKGQKLFAKVTEKLEVYSLPMKCADYNIKHREASKQQEEKQKAFFMKVQEDGLQSAAAKFCIPNFPKRCIYCIRVSLRKLLKRR